ncbi:MAG: hypothetical protein IT286_01355, partial [Proteobacteria bacterium]|nr:hypothetical protein [Pseudomonadota bacterium]
MSKKISPKEWVQILVAVFVVAYMGYFFSLTLQGHIFNATQGKWPIKQFSRFYMANVLELNSTTMVGDKTPIQYAIMNYGT